MRNKGKAIAIAVAGATAVAALFVASSGVASTSGTTTQATVVQWRSLNPTELHQLLVPPEQQPSSKVINDPITIKKAMETGQFEAAPSMTGDPSNCLNMGEGIGDLANLDGWIQSGERSEESAPGSLQPYFVTGVFRIPGGARTSIDRVAEILSGCTAGTLSLDLGNGQSIDGTIGYREQTAPAFAGAVSHSSLLRTVLNIPSGEGSLVPTTCDATLTILALGDTLVWSVEPTTELATQTVTAVYERAQSIS
jgi:hypothetical protein